MSMRAHPRDLHREVLQRVRTAHSDDPTWYAVWLGEPHREGSVLLGRTERLRRSRWWRAYPATGEYPQARHLWADAAAWLLEVREGHEKTSDAASAHEAEEAAEAGDPRRLPVLWQEVLRQ